MRHTDSGEYLGVPVVHISADEHWSGHRPDRVAAIAAA